MMTPTEPIKLLRQSLLWAAATATLLSSLGCVDTDRFYREWELCPQAKVVGNKPVCHTASAPTEKAKLVSVGMTKSEIRNIGGPLIDELNDKVWKLKQQFRPTTPGLYPYFDSREVYLYFDDTESLAAIIVRGAYSVYP